MHHFQAGHAQLGSPSGEGPQAPKNHGKDGDREAQVGFGVGYPQGRTGQGEHLSSLGLVSVTGVRITSYFWSGRQAENPI